MKIKILAITLMVLIIAAALPAVNALTNGASVDALDETVEIEISESGSKNYYSIDNLVGAKNKIISKENKDYYEIRDYELDDGTTIELIYPNGKQNNANNKIAIVNGTEMTQPRVYGKDGVTHIVINYDEFIHSEETVNYINDIGGRTTTVTNNLGRGDSWSQDGAAFLNQISGLETIETEDGTYTFSHWEDEAGNLVDSFLIEWENGVKRVFNFFAKYDFTPAPEPEPETNDTNETTPDPVPANTTDTNETAPAAATNDTNETAPAAATNNTTVAPMDTPDKDTPVSTTAKEVMTALQTGNAFNLLAMAAVLLIGGIYLYRKGGDI